jgi:hypothetical protein
MHPSFPLRTVSQWESAARGAFHRDLAADLRPVPRALPSVVGAYSDPPYPQRHGAARASSPARGPPTWRAPLHAQQGAARASSPARGSHALRAPPLAPPPPPHGGGAGPRHLFPHAGAAAARRSPSPLPLAPLDPLAPQPHPSVSRFLEAAAAQLGVRAPPPRAPSSPPSRSGGSPGRVFGAGTFEAAASMSKHDAPGSFALPGITFSPSGRVDPVSWGAATFRGKGVLKELRLPSPHATLPVPRARRTNMSPTLGRLESFIGERARQQEPPREHCLRCNSMGRAAY